ncbi:alginate lyase family protein, partial [Escherichia coli]|nr:alginate lyase family protein [Escherichia coli]
FHYSLFNMEAHLLLCRYGEHVEIDRWEWVQDGSNVQQGIDYLLPFIAELDLWPFRDLRGIDYDSALRLLLQAARGYPKEAQRYQAVLATLPADTLTSRDRLMWQS